MTNDHGVIQVQIRPCTTNGDEKRDPWLPQISLTSLGYSPLPFVSRNVCVVEEVEISTVYLIQRT